MKQVVDRMALDLDIGALAHMPPGYSEVLTYQDQYCSLDHEPEFPGVVTMRAADGTDRTLWVICSRYSCTGTHYDEAGYGDDPPYMHPACDADGQMISVRRMGGQQAAGMPALPDMPSMAQEHDHEQWNLGHHRATAGKQRVRGLAD